MVNTMNIEVTVPRGSNLSNIIETNLKEYKDESIPAYIKLWVILTKKDGDKKVIWDPYNFTEIREASETFKKLIKVGMVPYICDSKGIPTGEVMVEFDPSAGEVNFKDIIFAPSKLAVGG